eukprot:tig00001093_g6888.t1
MAPNGGDGGESAKEQGPEESGDGDGAVAGGAELEAAVEAALAAAMASLREEAEAATELESLAHAHMPDELDWAAEEMGACAEAAWDAALAAEAFGAA